VSRLATLPGPRAAPRLATIPNALSAARLAAVPVFLWLMFGRHDQLVAAYVLAGVGATDWLDGFLARRLDQVSAVGQVLDPAADRVLLGAGVIAITIAGVVPLWMGVAVLVREAVVTIAVLILAVLGAARVQVVWVGKAGTFLLMVAFPLFLAAHSLPSWHGPLETLAWCLGTAGLALAWYAALTYLPLARRALATRHDTRA
jgi:cardiolipin synthase (CMP-forming)